MTTAARARLKRVLEDKKHNLSDILLELLAIPSPNPPADTRAIAEATAARLREATGIDVELHSAKAPIVNVVAVLRGAKPGPRLVFNGHLDTFEIGDRSAWTVAPDGERIRDRIYGRGAGDMKGGVAAQIYAALCLSQLREAFCGELVLVLTGDEQSGGAFGTAHLLDHMPAVAGDAMMCADAGSPNILRFGEKGVIWMTLRAEGKAGHGAHTHLTENAIDRLLVAMMALKRLEERPVAVPGLIEEAIRRAAPVSERINGAGEMRVLTSITVNPGRVSGGVRCNLAPREAQAGLDIRFPPGVSLVQMQEMIAAELDGLPGISYDYDYALDVSVTNPGERIIDVVTSAGAEILGERPVATMRVGSSDASYFRAKAIPAVVCGLTAHNMGDADEYVELHELEQLARIYALSAFDFLADDGDDARPDRE